MTDAQVTERGDVVDPTESTAHKRLLSQTVRNLVLSMGLIGGIIAVVMILTAGPQPDPVREVDSLPVAQQVAAAVGWPVLHPVVGDRWRATSARFTPTEGSDEQPVWFNGWVTPGGEYVAIIQSPTTDEDFVAEQTIDGFTVTDRAEVPDSVSDWQAFVTRDGDQRSLVQSRSGVTTVVTGTVPWSELVAFKDSLEPVG